MNPARDPDQPDAGTHPPRPSSPPGVRSVEATEETEAARAWTYTLRVFWEGGRLTTHAATLRWADHDHWSGGAHPPSRVLECVARAAAETLGPDALPTRFDASSLRRRVKDLDARVRELL
ncbi:MAG: hypothetical protein ACF8Q5_13500 [Phycisphaerales bacterium JB040]